MILTSTIFEWSTRVTDRQTDGRTDGWAIAHTPYNIHAVARKNRSTFEWEMMKIWSRRFLLWNTVNRWAKHGCYLHDYFEGGCNGPWIGPFNSSTFSHMSCRGLLVRERSALATIIVSRRVAMWFCLSFCPQLVLLFRSAEFHKTWYVESTWQCKGRYTWLDDVIMVTSWFLNASSSAILVGIGRNLNTMFLCMVYMVLADSWCGTYDVIAFAANERK